jgi:hypothetical protein
MLEVFMFAPPNGCNQLTGSPTSVLKVIGCHLQEMFDAIFVSAFQPGGDVPTDEL